MIIKSRWVPLFLAAAIASQSAGAAWCQTRQAEPEAIPLEALAAPTPEAAAAAQLPAEPAPAADLNALAGLAGPIGRAADAPALGALAPIQERLADVRSESTAYGGLDRFFTLSGPRRASHDAVEAGAAAPLEAAPTSDRSKGSAVLSNWLRDTSTKFKVAAVMVPAGASLLLGRLEVAWRSRKLLKQYPGAKPLGGGHSNVVLLAKDPDGTRRIVKQYGIAGTLLGRLARLVLPIKNPGDIHRAHRFESDRDAFRDFEKAGIPASRILSSDPKKLVNVSSFVEGRPLIGNMDDDSIAQSGRSLRMAHDIGWAIIDNQPSNFIIGKDGRAYFIDLEHAYRDPKGEYRAWDVAIYLCWLREALSPERAEAAEAAFWKGYGDLDADTMGRVNEIRGRMSNFGFLLKISSMDSEASSK